MPGLIDKERAYTALKHEQYTHGLSFTAEAFEKAARIIDQMPTIEAEPVRHGRWIFVGEETMHDGWTYRKHKCSECGFSTVEAIKFCQNCGARMDGGDDND